MTTAQMTAHKCPPWTVSCDADGSDGSYLHLSAIVGEPIIEEAGPLGIRVLAFEDPEDVASSTIELAMWCGRSPTDEMVSLTIEQAEMVGGALLDLAARYRAMGVTR